jgi:hypothetical protein
MTILLLLHILYQKPVLAVEAEEGRNIALCTAYAKGVSPRRDHFEGSVATQISGSHIP